MDRGYRRVRDDARGASVHVACSVTFAMHWLVPHLGDFYRAHPDIRIRLTMDSPRERFEDDADVILTWDRLSFPEFSQVSSRHIILCKMYYSIHPRCCSSTAAPTIRGANLRAGPEST
ncbi:LysR substrate-binding domain-containing protein [Rhizobium sp. ERR 1071]|uniref:LysR substrate-binding domain-containing protein n=1 Tax=Rhizobium sp. ERR 1071 TaxID=2572677 RepID=UPI003FA6E846